jgi:thioredoxin-like negative regulator of GroEL
MIRGALLRSLLTAFALSSPAWAKPFVPTDDAQVLERLPDRSSVEYRQLKLLKAKAAAAPGDVDAAVKLADAYYGISRREGDPRYLGYAQAALTPWWKDPEAPTAVLVTRATLLQSNHEFPHALADLDKAIAREPDNARAILVRATILTVQGHYEQALANCNSMQGIAGDTYVLVCIASIDAVTGKAKVAEDALKYWLATLSDAAPDLDAWIESLLGEIAQRSGDSQADAHFRAALAADPRDLYTIGAYSDWLLEQNRAAEVIPLVEKEQRVDGLLLRLALAQKALRLPEADATVATLRARFDASRARGDVVHRREEARFQLMLNNDAAAALRLALSNWTVQREPADLRILAEAAHATGDAAALKTARDWLAATRLEYPAIAKLVNVEEAAR